MKRYLSFSLTLFLLGLLLQACQADEIPAPESAITCSGDFSQHSQHPAYQALLDEFAETSFVGISLLIDHPQEGLWMGAAGYADLENGIAMETCHRHHAASLIKSYIAVVILQLAEEDRLSLDDRLDLYLDAAMLDRLPNGREFTIRQLLQCRSGMPDVFESSFLLDFMNAPVQQYSMDELLAFLYGVDPVAAPGAAHYYGDGNFILLSMVIEALDAPLGEAIEQRIFSALGTGESFFVESADAFPQGVPASYWDRLGNGNLENVSDYQMALTSGLAGTDGLVGTVEDFYLFSLGLRDGTLLQPASYAEMVDCIAIPAGESQQNYAGYGLGIGQVQLSEEVWYGSFGNHVGSSAMFLHHPESGVTLTAAQNTGTFFNDSLKADFFGRLILGVEAIAF